jgi:hypothetical protein
VTDEYAPEPAPRVVPAGRALAVIAVALLLGGLFNSGRFLHSAEGMPLGWRRSVLLTLARPLDATARFLRTDRPVHAADRALGHTEQSGNGGAFEDPSSVLPTVSPSPGPSGSPGASASPSTGALGFRDATAAEPLRLFVTGDSMIEFMAPKLFAEATRVHAALDGESEVKYGTGLVRDDFFDWPAHAREQMAKRDPEAVIMMMGGNDGQGITLRGGTILHDGTPEWAAEYQRRATIMMRLITENGRRRVYWVGMPVPRSERLARDYAQINAALRDAAAAVPGARYVDITADFAPDGHYTDFVGGQLVRARDGIHLNRDGSVRLMRKLLALLDADWKLTG